MDGNEIDLFDLVQGLWERRLLIVLCMIISLAAGLAYIFLATPLYKISMQVRPGITGYGTDGTPLQGWSISDIAAWINDDQYRLVLENSAGSTFEGTKIEATPGSKDVLLIYLYDSNPAKGREILSTLFLNWVSRYVHEGGDNMIRLGLDQLEKNISTKTAELKSLDEVKGKKIDMQIADYQDQIASEKSKINLIQQRRAATQKSIEDLNPQVKATQENTAGLVAERNLLLKEASMQDFSLMLYLNVIQQNIYYVSQLQQQVVKLEHDMIEDQKNELELKRHIEDLKRLVDAQELEKKQVLTDEKDALVQQIDQLEVQKASITPIEKISGPISSLRPVRPRKMLILALALVFGSMLGVMAAFLANAWKARRENA